MIIQESDKGNVQRFRHLLDCVKEKFGEKGIKTLLSPRGECMQEILEGNLEVVREMSSLEEVDLLKFRTEDGENVLHVAALSKNESLANFIIEECSFSEDEINELFVGEAKSGHKPIDYAILDGSDETVLRFWERHPSPLNLEQHITAMGSFAFRGGNIPFLKSVIASGRKHHGKQMTRILNDQFPLLTASENGHSSIVEVLLSCEETEVTKRDSMGTVLMVAASKGHCEIVKLLLEKTHLSRDEKMEFISIVDWKGNNAIDIAKLNYHKEVVEVCQMSFVFFSLLPLSILAYV